jgi:hypothetical protein
MRVEPKFTLGVRFQHMDSGRHQYSDHTSECLKGVGRDTSLGSFWSFPPLPKIPEFQGLFSQCPLIAHALI